MATGKRLGRAGRSQIEQLDLEAFGRRLDQKMKDKGMHASALAKAVWGTTVDPRGYTVARNRDRIGAYLRGAGAPTQETLEKIADVLGTKPEELAPELLATQNERQQPEVLVQSVAGQDHAVVRLNILLPKRLAAKLAAYAYELADEARELADA